MLDKIATTSTRPYLIRALHEWCTDNGLTPYVAVMVDTSVQVPREYVKDGEIVLNVSLDATSSLALGNEFIEFKARFAGVSRDIAVPINRVIAIYARENGQGMAFPLEATDEAESPPPEVVGLDQATGHSRSDAKQPQLASVDSHQKDDHPDGEPNPPRPGGGARPALKRVK